MASMPERVAALEARLEPNATRNTLLGVFLTAAVGGLGWWMYWVTTSLTAIKQQLADGGNKQLVAQLEAPKSLPSLRETLIRVAAQAEGARVAGVKPDRKTLVVSKALANVAANDPSVSEVWRAASQMVNYRYQFSDATSAKNCLLNSPPRDDSHEQHSQEEILRLKTDALQNKAHAYYIIRMQNCTLDLADVAGFQGTPDYKDRKSVDRTLPIWLLLTDVQVKYSGGPTLPVSALQMVRCNLGFDLEAVPQSALARDLTLQALKSDTADEVTARITPS